MTLSSLLLALLIAPSVRSSEPSNPPSQIHLSVGLDPSKMNVQWSSAQNLGESHVLYGSSADDLSSKVESNSFPFKDGGAEGYTQHHHVASMTNLIPFERVFYN
jgi:hypothetical protein